jgi:transmembrane sensor
MTRDEISLSALRALTPAQAAARWLANEDRYESPHVEVFDAWLADSEANRVAWDAAEAMWASFDDAEENALIAAMHRAARQARPEPAPRAWWPQLLAASLVVAVAGGVLFAGVQGKWLGRSQGPVVVASADPMTRIGEPDYISAKGQKSIVDLPDGSRLTLDSDSAVDVAFAGDRRDLRLVRGRAFFDVAHDPSRPFAVEAGGRVVTALGTQFDVRLQPGQMRVVLVEGSVSVVSAKTAPPAPMVKLRPGEAFAAQDGRAGTVGPADVDADEAWRQGFVEFDNEPLSKAVATLNRYTRAQVVIKDPKVATLRITGMFRTGDVQRFGRTIAAVLPVRLIKRDADTYELVATGRS